MKGELLGELRYPVTYGPSQNKTGDHLKSVYDKVGFWNNYKILFLTKNLWPLKRTFWDGFNECQGSRFLRVLQCLVSEK